MKPPPPHPAPAPAPSLLPAPTRPAALQVARASFDVDALGALLASPMVGLDAVARALTAFRLGSAQSFDELFALASMRGVESHLYQIETVRRVLRTLRGRALLADEVGLGKTVEAMLILREYQLRGMVRRVLVLVPPALVAQWTGELREKAGVEARTTEQTLLRTDPDRFWRDDGVVVASLALARTARHAPLVQGARWDLVIVDEAHHLKNRATLGWKLVDRLETRFLLLLTATPVENDLEELYNLVTLLRPGQLASISKFRRQFVDRKAPTSPRNRERLRGLLGEVMVRNTRAQSGLRLPPRFVTTVRVEPHAAEKALYDAAVAMFRNCAHEPGGARGAAIVLLEAGSSPRAVASTVARMRDGAEEPARSELARLTTLAEAASSTRKSEALVEIARTHAGHILVFTHYRETLAFVSEALAVAAIPTETFHGGMAAAEKRDAIERFRDRGGVMLATDVGAEGQNLQFASVLVNFDLPWNPMVLEQRIGRLHRMGQEQEVRVYNLCAAGTIEERVLGVLHDRLHLFELVVGEMDMVLGNLADDRDLEQRILALYAAARSDDEVGRGFDVIADELTTGRLRLDRTKAFDEALFGQDYDA